MSTSRHLAAPALAAALLAAQSSLGACTQQTDLDEKFAPPRRIDPPVERTETAEYELLPEGGIEFSFGPSRKRVQGRLPLAQGRLRLSADALLGARGTLRFDLARLEVEASEEWPPASGPLTQQALRWLQIIDRASLVERPALRIARVSVVRLGGAEVERAREGRPVRGLATGAARRVRLAATFELELHGIISPYTAPLELTFHWPSNEPSGPPERIDIESEPIELELLEHRVWPRDEQGEVLAEQLAALRARPIPELRVRATLRARRLDAPSP